MLPDISGQVTSTIEAYRKKKKPYICMVMVNNSIRTHLLVNIPFNYKYNQTSPISTHHSVLV